MAQSLSLTPQATTTSITTASTTALFTNTGLASFTGLQTAAIPTVTSPVNEAAGLGRLDDVTGEEPVPDEDESEGRDEFFELLFRLNEEAKEDLEQKRKLLAQVITLKSRIADLKRRLEKSDCLIDGRQPQAVPSVNLARDGAQAVPGVNLARDGAMLVKIIVATFASLILVIITMYRLRLV